MKIFIFIFAAMASLQTLLVIEANRQRVGLYREFFGQKIQFFWTKNSNFFFFKEIGQKKKSIKVICSYAQQSHEFSGQYLYFCC